MKFKVGDKVRVVKNTTEDEFDDVRIGDVGIVVDVFQSGEFQVFLKIGEHDEYGFKEEELELIKEGSEDERLTFDEVMSYRQPNQTWIGENYIIHTDRHNDITIESKYGNQLGSFLFIQSDLKYKLQAEKSDFIEAFKSYEEGRVVVSEYGFMYKKENNRDLVNEDGNWIDNEESFTIEEIRGCWYIR